MDALAALLRDLRFHAAGYRLCDLSAPWALSFEQAHLRGLHIVLAGRCVLTLSDGTSRALAEGDLVILPRADPHQLRSDKGVAAVPAGSLAGDGPGGHVVYGGGGVPARILCGAFRFDASSHPALLGLPRLIHLAGSNPPVWTWLGGYVETLQREALLPGPGSEVLLGNLTAALLSRALRETLVETRETGWLRGLSDPGIARALAAIHDNPASPWTLTALAREAGQSRSVFADAFHRRVGTPPMQYLFQRRMRMAESLLMADQMSLADIAATVGYGSEAAFSSAFRRHSGMPPGRFRRTVIR